MDKILEKVLNTQSESYNTKAMNRTIRDIVKTIPGCVVKEDNGNIYITKGKADKYNCIVAHTDTVHDIIPQQYYKVVELEGRVFAWDIQKMQPNGVGGDDKVGIAIALHALKDIDNLKVVMFRDEEVGGHGSRKADMKFFDDVNFILQCDRKGNSGIVSNIYGETLFDKEFSTDIAGIISKYGYKEVEGMFTDVYQLVLNGLDIACTNIECGYYNPHQDNEYIVLADYLKCKEMVMEMLTTLDKKYYVDRTYEPIKYYNEGKYSWDMYADYCWECGNYAALDEQEMLCEKCMCAYYGEEHYHEEEQEELIAVHTKKKFVELFPEGKIK